MYKANVLIIDDEPDLVELLKYNLAKEGYKVEFAFNGFDGLRASEVFKPDLLILDIMLPDINGYEVCKRIKRTENFSTVPVIFLSAKQEEVDKVLGFESGAEDYITKPFSVAELLARVRTILRRVPPASNEENSKTGKISDGFGFKNITINVLKHSVMVKNIEIKLSPIEFKLLIFLMTYSGDVFSREKLLDNVWGSDSFVEPRTVDVHIRRLRSNIEIDESIKFIETIRGVGYKFIDEKI
ncbi:MAG: response regulator transcription factor [Candidatus Acidulodesulfobacterium acidiphilum]|uniref:Response regulator transcription factor n=1 Tax=Candidatus Acidulodesulfobacterium acidiphilum TaxID=2597224 RepID=A0A520XBZ4_9DELT|nr:MAG: response regulator transcription factor [Candidatus Acidulodesulfobacterium acidiphilum]